MNPKPKLVEEQPAESDFIDDIAALLPAEQLPFGTATWRTCAACPPMTRCCGSPALWVSGLGNAANPSADRHRTATNCFDPKRQRQGHAVGPTRCRRTASATRRATDTVARNNCRRYQSSSDCRETQRESAPAVRGAGIPETAQALAVVSKQTRQVAGAFDQSSKQLTDSYRGAAGEARRALNDLRGSIEYATASAKQAAHDLTHTFLASTSGRCSFYALLLWPWDLHWDPVLPLDQFNPSRTGTNHCHGSIAAARSSARRDDSFFAQNATQGDIARASCAMKREQYPSHPAFSFASSARNRNCEEPVKGQARWCGSLRSPLTEPSQFLSNPPLWKRKKKTERSPVPHLSTQRRQNVSPIPAL